MNCKTFSAFSSFVDDGFLVLGFLTLPVSSNSLIVLSIVDFEIEVISFRKVEKMF